MKATTSESPAQTFAIDMTELQLGVPHTNQLVTGAEHYYKVNTPSSQTLTVTLDSAATNGVNELFTSFGSVPLRSSYGFGYADPFAPDQQNVVPQTQQGYYYSLARGSDVPGQPATYQVTARLDPFGIHQVSPSRGGNAGRVTLLVRGAMFSPTAQVLLRRNGTEIATFDRGVANPAYLYARFDLRGRPAGLYDLVVLNPGGQFAVLSDGFEVVEGGAAKLIVQLIGPSEVRPNVETMLTAYLWNDGLVDAEDVVVRVTGSIASSTAPHAFLSELGVDVGFPEIQLFPLVRPMSGNTIALPRPWPFPIEFPPIPIDIPMPIVPVIIACFAVAVDASPVGEYSCDKLLELVLEAKRLLVRNRNELAAKEADLADCELMNQGQYSWRCDKIRKKVNALRELIARLEEGLDALCEQANAMNCEAAIAECAGFSSKESL